MRDKENINIAITDSHLFAIEWQRMASFRMLYIVTLTYIFKVIMAFQEIYNIISEDDESYRKMIKLCSGWYSSSNGVIGNVVHRDPDLGQGHKIWNANFRKTVRASENDQVRLLYRLMFAIEGRHCECCTSWPWPIFSRSQNLMLHCDL